MGLEETIKQILSSCSNIRRQEIIEMIEKKKTGICGFLTDETAARIVASELGVKTIQKSFQLKIQIQDLFSGLNDVTISGQVFLYIRPKHLPAETGQRENLQALLYQIIVEP